MPWSERARQAALALSTGDEREDDSLTVRLLRDIHGAFNGDPRLNTSDLLERLYVIEESPWGDWHGKPLSAHGLSRMLKPYRIKTMPVKVDGETVRGYKVEQFADAFARALGVTGVTSVTSKASSQAGGNAGNAYPSGRPLLGDAMYPVYLADKVKEGHLTPKEARQQYAHHRRFETFCEESGRGA
jgi:hypothetical protein